MIDFCEYAAPYSTKEDAIFSKALDFVQNLILHPVCKPMIGEKRQLVTDEAVEFEK